VALTSPGAERIGGPFVRQPEKTFSTVSAQAELRLTSPALGPATKFLLFAALPRQHECAIKNATLVPPKRGMPMKAAFIERHGGPEVLKFGEMPDPAAAPGEVVVDIVAASVNGADWKVREGISNRLSRFPYILGRDFSGVVSAVGEGVGDLRVGDEVFGVCDVGQEGAYAEKIAIKAAIVARKTDRLSHVDAAALALAGLTAICAIEDTLKLKAGETILSQGGAGGVASFAIQLAKHLGARVITTASASNHDYLRKIGADEIIDYNAVDFTKVVRDCDAVFDTVGGDVAQRSFTVLKSGGRAAFIASGAQAPKPDRGDVVALRPSVGRDRPHLERIVALVALGAVRPPEVTRYQLSEAAAAHKLSQSRHFRGKLVFQVR
jgi:NADPH:quinone reductase-like Zn-dependent oxidoreductase